MPGGQKAPNLTDPIEIEFWNTLLSYQGHEFITSGRGKRHGVAFTYTIRGAEMFVTSRSKSITRATILYAYYRVREKERQGEIISGPKSIGVHGDSYLFAVFKEIGIIKGENNCRL